VSHLDSDHVSGLDDLLARTQAKVVVLPYLEPFELLMIIARATAEESVTGTMVGLVGDCAGWFSARGVETIIFVQSGEEEGGGEEGGEAVFPEGPNAPDAARVLGLDLEVLRRVGRPLGTKKGSDTELLVLPQSIPLQLRTESGFVDWMFLPFVHPEKQRVASFKKVVRQLIGSAARQLSPKKDPPSLSTAGLLAILQDRKLRRELAKAYLLVQGDRNLTSMALYSGPTTKPSGVATETRMSWGERSYRHSGWGGWLGTGDANLADPNRRAAFLAHYLHLMPLIDTLTAPHHGSRHSFDEELLTALQPRALTFSAGKRSRHGHPHREVTTAARLNEVPILVTTEQPESELFESVSYER